MPHEPGHIDFNTMDEAPQVQIQPEEKQVEEVFEQPTSSTIKGKYYDYGDGSVSLKTLITKELPNLDFESTQYYSDLSGLETDKLIGIFNSTKPIGYDNADGGKPILINDVLPNASDAEKLEYIYNTITYNRDTIQEKKDAASVRAKRDNEGKAWVLSKDGKVFEIDWTKEEEVGAIQNIFGTFLPFVDSKGEKQNRKRAEMELAELGLTPETADNLREQLKESHWYIKDGKIQYNENTKDLSYLIPDINDYSFDFQYRQILGNVVDDFPSLVLSGYAALSKAYQTSGIGPDERLLDPEKNLNIFGMDVKSLKEGNFEFPKGDDRLKSEEQYLSDVEEYASQKAVELAFVEELVGNFDEKKQTQLLWAPFKNLHKNIVYNNTGFEMTGEMVEQFENPTDSFLYHAVDVIAEGLPYIAAIEGVAAAYGIRGTMVYNEATDYVLANTGHGLKHSNPIKALNYFLKNHVTNQKMKGNPSKFIERTMKRLDERQATTFGIKRLKVNLQKEIDTITKQIDNAKIKGDAALVEKLSTARETLIRNQLDLKPRYWTKGQVSLFRNEMFAAVFGGVGRDILGDGIPAAGLEIGGALAEPYMFTQGFKGVVKSSAYYAGSFIEKLPLLNKTGVKDYLLGKSLSLNPEDIIITDSVTGLPRKLNKNEVRAIRGFSKIVEDMPNDARMEVLASMNGADEALQTLIKDLSDEDAELVKYSLSQYTGLAALQAVAEMYNVQKLNTVFSSSDLVQINNQIAQSQGLITIINNSMSKLLERNPNNPQVQNFSNKIKESIEIINGDLDSKAQEFDAALEALVDLEKGLNLFDNPSALNQNIQSMMETLENIRDNGFSESARQTANNLLQNFDQKILDDMKNIADELKHDGENYKVNGFASILFAFKQYDKVRYKKFYSNLYNADKNFTLDFTEYFDDVMGGIFPQGRFGKLKEATGLISNKLPSSSETSKFVKVIQTAVERNTLDWIKNSSNRKAITDMLLELPIAQTRELRGAPDIFYDTLDSTRDLLKGVSASRNLTDDEAIRVFETIKSVLKYNNTVYKDVPVKSITGIDVRDFFLGFDNVNIPIKMNLQEAMEFKSGIGSFAYTATEKSAPKSRTFMEMYNEVENVLFTAINNSGNDELITNYAEAINAYRDYINKYNNTRFKDLKTWTKTKDKGTQLKVTQDGSANSSKKLEKIEAQDDYATEIYRKLEGKDDVDGVARFTTETNPSNWIKYDKLLYDAEYADNFMKNVIAPLVGKRDPSKVTTGATDDILYVIDLNDAETVQKLQIVRGFLQEGMANWFRRTPQGQLVLGENVTKKILQEDKLNDASRIIKLDVDNKIRLDDNASSWYKITSTDGRHINILNINNIINTNLAFDQLLARDKFVGQLTMNSNQTFAKVFKNAKKETQKQLKEYKQAKLKLNDVLFDFGTDLTDSKTFVESIMIGNGDLTQFNKLKNQIVGTGPGKISAEEFDTITKEQFAKYFFERFSKPVQGKSTIKAIDGAPIKELNVDDSFFENVFGAKAFLKQNNKNLVGIFGQQHVDDINKILDVVIIKSGVNTGDINKGKLPQSLSVESLISRLYSINRGIISPKYVATEVSLQRFRKSKAHMMEELIKNPELATVIRKVLESDNIYKDNITNSALEKLLNKTVVAAVLLRESAEFSEEKLESNQDEMLNELNEQLKNVSSRL